MSAKPVIGVDPGSFTKTVASGATTTDLLTISNTGNLAVTTQTLSHWRLLDKNGRVTPIDATIGAGASFVVALDGSGVQLGNNGGNLILQDQSNAQVDVVTYTAQDAAADDRYVRFRR